MYIASSLASCAFFCAAASTAIVFLPRLLSFLLQFLAGSRRIWPGVCRRSSHLVCVLLWPLAESPPSVAAPRGLTLSLCPSRARCCSRVGPIVAPLLQRLGAGLPGDRKPRSADLPGALVPSCISLVCICLPVFCLVVPLGRLCVSSSRSPCVRCPCGFLCLALPGHLGSLFVDAKHLQVVLGILKYHEAALLSSNLEGCTALLYSPPPPAAFDSKRFFQVYVHR